MDYKEVVSLLKEAASQDPDVLKEAENRLHQRSAIAGFYMEMAKISVSTEFAEIVRFQAVVYLKNSIERVWRKSHNNSIAGAELGSEEKREIRAVLLQCLLEPVDQISAQHAVLVSKIARHDCPALWPELIPTLAETIESSESWTVSYKRALQILHKVVKMMASKRLAPDRRRFHELTKLVFLPICGLLDTHLNDLHSHGAHNAELCLKSIRYMILYGYKNLPSHPDVQEVMKSLPKIFHQVTVTALTNTERKEQKHLWSSAQQISKIYRGIIELSPLDLIPWLHDALSLSFECATSEQAVYEKLRISCMNILKLILLCQDYKVLRMNAPEAEQSAKASSVIQSFFSDEVVSRLCGCVVERLVLGKNELDLWLSEPEAFDLCSRDSDSWEHDIKPCSESLYSTVVHEYWNILCPLIKDWVQYLNEPLDFADERGILKKDAVLSCLGLAAQDLLDAVDFSELFHQLVLSPSIWISTPPFGCKILQRRVLWLTEKWIGVKFEKRLRPDLYTILCHVLNSTDVDIVVQLAGCSTLKEDDFEFELDQFIPFFPTASKGLIELLKSCSEDDCRMKVVSCLTLMSERCGGRMKTHLGPILSYLPQLWDTDHDLLKNQMLVLLGQVVKSVGGDSVGMQDGLCQLVETGVNTENPGCVSLLEDALDLWLALVENSPGPLPEPLLRLFRCMPNLLTIQSEHQKMCLEIVVGYCLFQSEEFVRLYVAETCDVVARILPEMRSEGVTSGVVVVLKAFQVLLRCCGKSAIAVSEKILLWCFDHVLMEKEDTGSLSCFVVLSEASLLNPGVIQKLFTTRDPDGRLSRSFMQMWFRNIAGPSLNLERKKRCALALCAMVASSQPVSVLCFSDIMALLSELLHQLCSSDHNDVQQDLVLTSNRGNLYEEDTVSRTEQDVRWKKVCDSDPVFCVPFPAAISHSLKALADSIPAEQFQSLWESVDTECRQRISAIKQW